MAVEFRRYTEDLVPAVRAFNQRFRDKQVSFSLHETHVPVYPEKDGRPPYQEYALAVDGDDVRGGYQLKRQELFIVGEVVPAVALQLPVSEGAIDDRYTLVGIRIVQDALARAPLLYALGMGGADSQFVRLVTGMGWKVQPVPLYARVVRAFSFLRNVRAFRRSPASRLLLDAGAYSGLGWLGLRLYRLRGGRARQERGVTCEEVREAGAWADEAWRRARDAYALIGVRDSRYLETFFLSDPERFRVLKVSSGGRDIGWAVTYFGRAAEHKYFGNMRIGSIIDVLAEPEHALPVVCSATQALERAGADLILTNQSHAAWRRALEATGFKNLASTFMFGVSRPFAQKLGSIDLASYHLNRGDGIGGIMDPQLWGDRPVRHLSGDHVPVARSER